jgi:hypothetical protein
MTPLTDTLDLSLAPAAFAEHLQQPTPDFLYHYTGQDGLLGIIQSRSLWASNISYMNDATEFGLAHSLILDEIGRRIRKRESKADIVEWVTKQIHGSPICATCFCEKGDQLSQWRGYSGSGYGYSLGFIPSQLKAVASDAGFVLGRCIYDPDLQRQIISEGLDHIIIKGAPDIRETYEDVLTLVKYGAFFKDYSFREEDEWRLVLTTCSKPKQFFRTGRSMITPHVSLSITSLPNLGIGHAFVGPCPHMDLSVQSVISLFIDKGFDVGRVDVCPSKIPFRGW